MHKVLVVMSGIGAAVVSIIFLPISLGIYLLVQFWKRKTLANAAGLFAIWAGGSLLWSLCVEHFSPKDMESIKQGQLAKADAQITKLDEKRQRLLPLLEAAVNEKAVLIEKLRDAGIRAASDLQTTPSARSIVSALQKLDSDIRSLQAALGRADEGITYANAIKRRIEQEAAGVSNEELSALTGESGALESPIAGDPISLEALLTRELQGPAASIKAQPLRPGSVGEVIVGRWRPEGGAGDAVEFTPHGNVLVDSKAVATYRVQGKVLTLVPTLGPSKFFNWKKLVLEAEVLSPDEMVFSITAGPGGELQYDLEELAGKVRRISH